MLFRIRKGLDVEIGGRPEQSIAEQTRVSSVALLGDDYVGFRSSLLVAEGDRVRLGQPLVRSRDHPGLQLTSPGAGVVERVERGKQRRLRSIVIRLEGADEEPIPGAQATVSELRPEQVTETLLASGLWCAIRARPFNRTADPRDTPHSIFVTAMDTNPLAPHPEVVLAGQETDFGVGLEALTRLQDGPVFLCKRAGSAVHAEGADGVTVLEFEGPHPAGLPGTHMHLVDPVGRGKTNWHVGYQDVLAMGRLFTTGRLAVERVVSLAGPRVLRPRLLRTRLGASLDDLVRGELEEGECRIVSGSVLSGRHAVGWARHLGRYHQGICALAEGAPSGRADRAIGLRSLLGHFLRPRESAPTTALHGHPAAMVPIGAFERVMPLDLLPTPLLRALLIGDTETAESLGCLELDDEDLALCTYVCPSKLEYGGCLRSALAELGAAG